MWRKIKIQKSPMSGWGFFEVARAILGAMTVHYDNVYFIPIKLRSNNSIYWIIYCPNVKKKKTQAKNNFSKKKELLNTHQQDYLNWAVCSTCFYLKCMLFWLGLQ